MNENKLNRDVVVLMILKSLSMLFSYIYVPLVFGYLGQEKYGVWATLLSIIFWVNYFDIGVGNGVRNNLTSSLARDDKKKSKIYVSTGYMLTSIISFLIFAVFTIIFVSFDLTSYFNLELTDENSTVIIVISVGLICLNFICALAKSIAYAQQKSTLVSASNVIVQILNICIVFLLAKFTKASVLFVAIMYGATAIFGNVLLNSVVTHKRDFLKFAISSIRRDEVKNITSLGIMFFALQISSLVLSTTDNLLISRLFGVADVTPYSMVHKVFNLVIQLHSVLLTPMWSAYTLAAQNKQYKWMKKRLNKTIMLTGIISIGALVLIVIFRPLSNWWLGEELEYSNSLINLTALFCILTIVANVYNNFLCGIGNVKIPVIIAIVQAVINIPLSIFFATTLNMGLSGIILGSVISVALATVIDPIVSYLWLHRNIARSVE